MPEKRQKIKRKLNTSSSEGSGPAKISRKATSVAVAFTAKRLHDRPPGKLLVVGQGDVGQLGLGPDVPEKTRFAVVPGLTDIVDICTGGMHTVCLTSQGEVITFGCNDEGALGRKVDEADEGAEARPGKVELCGKAVQISAGDSHTAALLDDGRVFAWGAFRDSHGTMGLISEKKMELPTLLRVKDVKKIASGSDHLLMLTRLGEVFSCGCAEQGQLGRVSERGASRDSRQGLNQLLTPSKVPLKRMEIEDIWADAFSSFVRAKDDNVYVFGLNNYKQLGLQEMKSHYNPTKSKVLSEKHWVKLCGDQHHTIALDSDGVVYALGRKEYGRLGLGTLEDVSEVGKPTTIPLLEDKKCVDISCGTSCSFAVTDEGSLYAWGMGSSGQLGTGDEDDLWEPAKVKSKQLEGVAVVAVSAGGQHTALLARDIVSSTPMDQS